MNNEQEALDIFNVNFKNKKNSLDQDDIKMIISQEIL